MSDLISLLIDEDFLQEALLSAGVGFWCYDHVHDSIRWSPAMFAVVGGKPGDSPRNFADWFALIHPEDQARVKVSIQGALDAFGPFHEVQFRYRHSEGNWLWFHSRGRVIRRAPDGSPLITAGVTNNVSQLKQAESALEKSETRFNELVEHLPVGVYTLVHCKADNTLRFTYMNDRYSQIIGIGQVELTRDALLAINAAIPQDRDRLIKAYHEVLLKDQLFYFEGRFKVHGEVRWLSISSNLSISSKEEMVWNGVVMDVTERKLAEESISVLNAELEVQYNHRTDELALATEKLNLSESRLRFALKASNTGVWDWNIKTGKIFYLLPAEANHENHEGSKNVIQIWREMIHPEDRNAVKDASVRNLIESDDYEMEYRLCLKDGAYRWVLARGKVMERDAFGVPLRAIGTFTDIESRKQVELKNRKMAAVVKSSSDLVAIASVKGEVEYLNPAFRAVLGCGNDVAAENILIQDMHPEQDFLKILEEGIPSAIKTGYWQGDTTILSKSGSAVEVSQLILASKNSHNQQVEFLATICRNIMDRKQLEECLRESRQNFQLMVDTVPVVLYKYQIFPDGTDKFLYVGGKCRDILEFDDAALVADSGQIWGIIIPEDRQRLYEQSVKSLTSGRQDFSEEVRIVTVSGKLKWIQFYSLTSPSSIDGVPYWFGCILDITERKRLEQEVRAQLQELETVGRRKTEFLAMLAHELRNPMSPLLLVSQLLRQEGIDRDRLTWALDMIQRQIGHLSKLVDELLDVSRITQGKIKLDPKIIDLRHVLQEAVEMCQPQYESAHHQLNVLLPAEPVQVEADSMRLVQVVANLLNNAAKFTAPSGHIELSLVQNHYQAVITVKDDGVGIEADFLSDIFELFAQAESSPSKSHGGLGVGLYLAKAVVLLHGGVVEAQSQGSARGSEFIVKLPLMQNSKSLSKVGDMRHEGSRGHRRKILVVDDNIDAANGLRYILESKGHELRVAYNGCSALEIAEIFHPEVIFLDIGMPGMDGYEVCRKARATAWGEGVLLVAITGWGQSEDKQRAYEAGFDCHFTKPVQVNDLDRILDKPKDE